MKNMNLKRTLCAAIAVVLCIGAAGGCAKKNGNGTENKANLTANGEFPISKEPVTLSFMTSTSAYVEDLPTNEFTKYYEEKTNVKIDWQMISGDMNQKLNVIVASGNYPDVFLQCTIKKPAQMQYGRDGVIIPLNDLIENNTKWIKEFLEKEEYAKKQFTSPDGNIYGLGGYNSTYHALSGNKMWVYEPWLKKSGIGEINTTEDFKKFLIAVRDGDFNDNGKKDEIPLLGLGVRGTIKFIMNAFVPMDDYEDFEFYVENGKVKYSPSQEGFKEGLKYIQDLYNEGLLAKDSFVIDRQQRTATVENPDYPLVACCPALWYGQFSVNNGGTGRYADFTTIAPLEGPSGRRKLSTRTPLVDGQGFSISTSCSNPEAAIRWLDWFYSVDGAISASNGEEGKYWRKATESELNIKGEPAYYTKLSEISFGETQNKFWMNNVPSYIPAELEFGATDTGDSTSEQNKRLVKESDKYAPYLEDVTLPDMFYDDEVADEYSSLKATIYDTTYQLVADMILNGKDIEEQWDGYIAKLNAMGLERYIQIQQETYDKNYK